MIQDWLARKAGVVELADRLAGIESAFADRITALEQALGETRAAVAPIADRIAAIERELVERRTMTATLSDRIDGVERTIDRECIGQIGMLSDRIGCVERSIYDSDRQAKAIVRAVRAGRTRLDGIVAASTVDSDRDEAMADEVARLKASLAIVEARIDEEAEQTRRSVTGLLERIRSAQARDRTTADSQP